ncbi:MAG TPA: acetamidase/formamidase family protein, partial [Spirochaetia bacterium]|nr:acetamidase/formamidase family protein [Spirochaetia bacterium]
MKRIKKDKVIYSFDYKHKPVEMVDDGEEFIFETLDALGGRIHTVKDALDVVLPRELHNPATGPVYINGAEPGDTLAVKIIDIKLGEFGYGRVKGGGVII